MIIGSIIGAFFAVRVEMTQMPQLVAIFNGFGGGASALVASSEFLKSQSLSMDSSIFLVVSIVLSILVGTLTFTGSFIAFGKLQGIVTTKPIKHKVFEGGRRATGMPLGGEVTHATNAGASVLTTAWVGPSSQTQRTHLA
jgi:NAD/NADP transhydrogenase beta subunit